MDTSQSQPCGVGPSDLTTGLDAEPSAAENRHRVRTLREILTEHREREERFAGYHRQMIQRGEASDWSERAAEESDRAEALEWAIAALAKAEGRS